MKPEELLKKYNSVKGHVAATIEDAKAYLKDEVLPDETERNIIDGFISYMYLKSYESTITNKN